jgi:hypothetical protein
LLERLNALVFVGLELSDVGFEPAQAVAVLLGLAEHVGHLLFERVEALVEADHRGLGRGRIIGESRRVCRAALREDAPLNLVHLALEALEPLLGSRRLTLRESGRSGRQRNQRAGGEDGR